MMNTIMKRLLLLILCTVSVMPLLAQEKRGVISVSARENVVHRLPKDVAYVFPDFADATLNYDNGRFSVGCLNIRLLDNFILYIEEKTGDTLVLSNPDQVRDLVCMDTVYRIVNDCVVKVISEAGDRQFAQRFRLKLTEEQEDAGYSALPPSSTAVTGNVNRIDPSRNPDAKRDFSYKHERDYVLMDGDKVYPAKISSFNRLFPEKKKAIKAYVRDNDLDTGTRAGLVALFEFCAGN